MKSIFQEANMLQEQIVTWRRDLHRIPETGLFLPQTKEYVAARLKEMGLTFPKPEGAFYIFADISRFGMTGEEFCEKLIRQARVAAVPGSCFGGEGFIRLSYCCGMDRLSLGMDRLETFLKQL